MAATRFLVSFATAATAARVAWRAEGDVDIFDSARQGGPRAMGGLRLKTIRIKGLARVVCNLARFLR